MSPLLTVEQVCALLAVRKSWVYQAVAEGRIPHVRLGERGPVRFRPEELEQWLSRQSTKGDHR